MSNIHRTSGIAGVTLAALLTWSASPASQAVSGDQSPMMVKAGDIAGSPDKYFGKKVSVHAEVEDVVGRQAFLLDEDKLFAWPDVLVITPALTGWITEEEMVTVVGTVRRFVDTDFRRDYKWDWWDDWDADIVLTFRDRPVIVAESVKTHKGVELVKGK